MPSVLHLWRTWYLWICVFLSNSNDCVLYNICKQLFLLKWWDIANALRWNVSHLVKRERPSMQNQLKVWLKVTQWQSSRSPTVLIERLFLGLVAACWEHKVTGQKTQRPKHTLQDLQPGELYHTLAFLSDSTFPLSICKLGFINTVSCLFAQMQQWCSHPRSVSKKSIQYDSFQFHSSSSINTRSQQPLIIII